MASTGCCFHNRRAIRLSSRRANRQSSRSTRFVVITSLFCMVGPPSRDLPLSEDQPRIKPIPYVGISVTLEKGLAAFLDAMLGRNRSTATLRAYRTDVLQFMTFLHENNVAITGVGDVGKV